MLVLTRKLGQSIRIGDSIRIQVVEVRGNQIRLGIEAPPEIRVLREELYQQVAEKPVTEGATHLGEEAKK
ncbi:MAG: hypothetical protein KatS3mg076_3168 [Candidatus Binatia bacterium]|nr:MAG: hypothetical protein KatS3mg076_3168 [Candidatus Binatia bacterium]